MECFVLVDTYVLSQKFLYFKDENSSSKKYYMKNIACRIYIIRIVICYLLFSYLALLQIEG